MKINNLKVVQISVLAALSFILIFTIVFIGDMKTLNQFMKEFAQMLVAITVGIGALSISYKEQRDTFISIIISLICMSMLIYGLSYLNFDVSIIIDLSDAKKIILSVSVIATTAFLFEVLKMRYINK